MISAWGIFLLGLFPAGVPQDPAPAKPPEPTPEERAQGEAALRKLKESPDDPEACLAYGKYLCFAKGSWEEGLPFLARGADGELKALAQADLEASNAAARFNAGEAWHKAASRPARGAGEAYLRRATFQFQAALPELTGMKRLIAEKRLEEQVKSPAPGVAVPPGAALVLTFNKSTVYEKGEKRYARDLSGNRLDAELVGGTLERGVLGEALRLDGEDDHAVVPAGKALDVGDRAVTIACWVSLRKEFHGEAMLVEHDVWGAPGTWQLTLIRKDMARFNSPKFQELGQANDARLQFKLGEWRHLAARCDRKASTIFVDGRMAGTVSLAAHLPAGEAPLYIGSRGGKSLFFPGLIDELVIHPRALEDAEILALVKAAAK